MLYTDRCSAAATHLPVSMAVSCVELWTKGANNYR